jgi:hypothetical protein
MNWLDYFRECVAKFDFHPWRWDYDADENLRAFSSKAAFVTWYGQPPGPWHVYGVPSYRDESFYTRELATVSMLVQPKYIVEIGTGFGISALLLQILNPDAMVVSVDIANTLKLPDGRDVEIGYLAKMQNAGIRFASRDHFWFTEIPIHLCFVDGDHSYRGVAADTEMAWYNHNIERGAIVWHDHNERHPGVLEVVKNFESETKLQIHREPDSATVWAAWGC